MVYNQVASSVTPQNLDSSIKEDFLNCLLSLSSVDVIFRQYPSLSGRLSCLSPPICLTVKIVRRFKTVIIPESGSTTSSVNCFRSRAAKRKLYLLYLKFQPNRQQLRGTPFRIGSRVFQLRLRHYLSSVYRYFPIKLIVKTKKKKNKYHPNLCSHQQYSIQSHHFSKATSTLTMTQNKASKFLLNFKQYGIRP